MSSLRLAIAFIWIVFWLYWLAAAMGVKEGARARRRFPLGAVTIAIVVLLRFSRGGSLAVHSLALSAVGTGVVVAGLALAVWARLHLGRNWGMPMTEKAEPELVTSGPYRFVRHPIYTGLLLGMVGTALATSLLGLLAVAALGAYFLHAATVEERNLTATFPSAYPAYRARTKKLIPFVL